MNDTKEFLATIQKWLETFVVAYSDVLPKGKKPTTPYILYSPIVSKFANETILQLLVYELQTTSYAGVVGVVNAIEQAVGECGLLVANGSMRIRVKKGSPFAQPRGLTEENQKCYIVNLAISKY